jgi:hypothetical protein
VKGIPLWSSLAGVIALAALTGLGFDAKPALAGGDSRDYQNSDNGSDWQSNQDSPRGTYRGRQGDGTQDNGDQGWSQGYHRRHSQDGSRDRRDRRWGQGGGWSDGRGSQQWQGHRWDRGGYGRYGHGHRSRNAGWNDQDYGRNRGGCN